MEYHSKLKAATGHNSLVESKEILRRKHQIKHHLGVPLQENGQVEVTNRTIMTILKRKVGKNPKTWVDLILETLWDYRTMEKMASGYLPPRPSLSFTLGFGINAVAPTELVWSIARIDCYNTEANKAALLTKQEEKEELKEQALIKDLEYKRKMTRYHDACVIEK